LVTAGVLEYWMSGIRLGAQNAADRFQLMTEAKLPGKVTRLLRNGKLESAIGSSALEGLNACAKITNEVLFAARLAQEKPDLTKNQDERIRSAGIMGSNVMHAALNTLVNPVSLHRPLGDQDLALIDRTLRTLEVVRRDLARIVQESPDEKPRIGGPHAASNH
jgi:hypothetical protein